MKKINIPLTTLLVLVVIIVAAAVTKLPKTLLSGDLVGGDNTEVLAESYGFYLTDAEANEPDQESPTSLGSFVLNGETYVKDTLSAVFNVSGETLEKNFKSDTFRSYTEVVQTPNLIFLQPNRIASLDPSEDPVSANGEGFISLSANGILLGIDMELISSSEGIQRQFIVMPGANASDLKIQVEGSGSLSLSENGDLLMNGWTVNATPSFYQLNGTSKVALKGNFLIINDNTYGYSISSYDRNEPLYIVQ